MKWHILKKVKTPSDFPSITLRLHSGQARRTSVQGRQKLKVKTDQIIKILINNRGIITLPQIKKFLHPQDPESLTTGDVEIDKIALNKALKRIKQAIKNQESMVVYTDYDADGICGGAILWEVIHKLGGKVMPYVPHREDEGYGFSIKGIDAVRKQFNPRLIISVDHGITAREKIAYAKKQGMEIIVTDHHSLPKKIPDCLIIHTTKLSGAGVAWFLAKSLVSRSPLADHANLKQEYLALAAIGTIADLMPLLAVNRDIVSHGLKALNRTQRIGLIELIADAGLTREEIGTYETSHILAPRLNAMGRMEHALDALRLLCTNNKQRAKNLAAKLGLVNRERQQLLEKTTQDAMQNPRLKTSFDFPSVTLRLHSGQALRTSAQDKQKSKLIFIAHEEYAQGIIGLVAGKLVEAYYRPAIVVQKGMQVSKASARSIKGFNIIEAIRSCSDLLIDVGGHPMAAGFTVETKNLVSLQARLEQLADAELDEDKLTQKLTVDLELPLSVITFDLWQKLKQLEPFGVGNPRPVFATPGVKVTDAWVVGGKGQHLKLKLQLADRPFDKLRASSLQFVVFNAIGFGMGKLFPKLHPNQHIDIAYTVEINEWHGKRRLELKLKDIQNIKLSNQKN